MIVRQGGITKGRSIAESGQKVSKMQHQCRYPVHGSWLGLAGDKGAVGIYVMHYGNFFLDNFS